MSFSVNLKKRTTPLASLLLATAEGHWPSVNDHPYPIPLVTVYDGYYDLFGVQQLTGLNDATFGGNYDFSGPEYGAYFTVYIDSTGIVDTFGFQTNFSGTVGSYVPITAGIPQLLMAGVTITFANASGHVSSSLWFPGTSGQAWHTITDRTIDRLGVAVRGTIETASPCLAVNAKVLVTAESEAGSYALVVRDADTLALLYRKPLLYDATPLAWGDPPQKFSFSTNAEGLFFMHCYTVPVLTSPPTPYPGAEFGSPNPRKIAVISVDPLTFEPTITELITLEDRPPFTTGATFAVAKTV
jgi:hypothetical protein